MTSSVFFKFKSQKEPSRVSFDGTGISVFELKREIINKSRLGDGTEFELAIYNESTKEEYDDDTSIIPRSTSIIARRFPAARGGKGGAARYVSGKMPIGARASSRVDISKDNQDGIGVDKTSELDNTQTEDERIRALFNLQESQWRKQQEEMSTAAPIPTNRARGKPVNIPDHPPPPGYLCYRCREKGHWIQACPTNNDPNFDGHYRVKRSTGIPRSFQKQVEKPDTLTADASNEDLKLSGVMVNADGDFVIAQPDKASWELYQEKTKGSPEDSNIDVAEEAKQLESRGLLCPIDKRLLIAPTRTPCCQKTYCNDCISNALIESDFLCPNCGAEGVLLDDLAVDEGAISALKEYEAKRAYQNKDSNSSSTQHDSSKPAESTATPDRHERMPTRPTETNSSAKREPAEITEKDDEAGASAPTRKKQRLHNGTTEPGNSEFDDANIPSTSRSSQAPLGSLGMPMNPTISSHPLVGTGFPTFPGNTGQTSSLTLGGNGDHSQPPWDQWAGSTFVPSQSAPYSNNAGGPTAPTYSGTGNILGEAHFVSGNQQQHSVQHPFSNQQRTTFSAPFAKEEDNAYFRQPVNPHRHQARQRRIRPSDYREL